jgi:hypothetical protein
MNHGIHIKLQILLKKKIQVLRDAPLNNACHSRLVVINQKEDDI